MSFGPGTQYIFLPKKSGIQILLTTVHVSTVEWSISDASKPKAIDAGSGQGYSGFSGICECIVIVELFTKVSQSNPL